MPAAQQVNTDSSTEALSREILLQLFEDLKGKDQARLVLTVPELSRLLGINLPRCYALVRSEGFPSLRLGSRYIIPILGFLGWLERAAEEQIRL